MSVNERAHTDQAIQEAVRFLTYPSTPSPCYSLARFAALSMIFWELGAYPRNLGFFGSWHQQFAGIEAS